MSRDPGLQPERTALAWRRTALAMLVNGALLVRAAADAGSPVLWTVSAVVVLAALVMFAIGWDRHRTLVRASAHSAPHAAAVALVLAAVWLGCAAAVLSILT